MNSNKSDSRIIYMNDIERKSKIDALRKAIHKLMSKLNQLEHDCKHNIFKRDIASDCTSAVCLVCGEDFGWWCPKSPDHLCHYYSENGKIELQDGTKVDRPKDAPVSVKYETDDCCLFCHDPEERK